MNTDKRKKDKQVRKQKICVNLCNLWLKIAKEVHMRRIIVLGCVFLLFLAAMGCSGNKTEDTYIGRTAPIFSANTWTKLHCTYDGGTASSGVKIYIDGIQKDNADYKSGTFVSMRDTTAPFRIGKQNAGLATDFNGRVGWLELHARAMGAQEIGWRCFDPHRYYG